MDLHHQIKVLEVRSFRILSHLLKQKQLTKDTYMDFFFFFLKSSSHHLSVSIHCFFYFRKILYTLLIPVYLVPRNHANVLTRDT